MKINIDTKISRILKEHEGALDAIISISPMFEKLRNPLLRKLLAGRTTIAMASKIAGINPSAFFDRLSLLGFEHDPVTEAVEDKIELPSFITRLKKDHIIEFDVRPILASGNDPLNLILAKIKSLNDGCALKIINTFEPAPLINLLEKKGFLVYADITGENLVETYFYKESGNGSIEAPVADTAGDWDDVLRRFEEKIIFVDVRQLEMPQPMLTILSELERLPADGALYVYHKRIPVFLLPELSDRNFEYRIKEIAEGEVYILIFHK